MQPTGHMQPKMAKNATQHKIVNLLKTPLVYEVYTSRPKERQMRRKENRKIMFGKTDSP